tara:strand:+ start:16443 stop:16850 length:408 start_codon:yes stop_codon:yes gene_type:complete
MKFNIRKLTENDWDTLVSWWDAWPTWVNPPKDFLPDNGTGGLIIEKNNIPIVAGFLYFTNSAAVLLEWIISNPEYKEKDRKEAIETLIQSAEIFCKNNNKKYMFSIGRNKSLINIHKKLNWSIDEKASYEITKQI